MKVAERIEPRYRATVGLGVDAGAAAPSCPLPVEVWQIIDTVPRHRKWMLISRPAEAAAELRQGGVPRGTRRQPLTEVANIVKAGLPMLSSCA